MARFQPDLLHRPRLLRRYELVDTAPEPALDELAALAASVCSMPVAFLGLVEPHRDWFKARFGTELTELPRESALCGLIVQHGGPLVVPDTLVDRCLQSTALAFDGQRLRFLAGVPIAGREGQAIGALCVVDTQPRTLSDLQLNQLCALAGQAASLLELRLLNLEAHERERELRERTDRLTALQAERDDLISFVVHDLKNPLAAILMNAQYGLRSGSIPTSTQEALADIVAQGDRMQRLLNDMLDIRRGRGRLVLRPAETAWSALASQLGALVNRRFEELGRHIELVTDDPGALLSLDASLMLRVLQNLVDNALKYASPAARIVVSQRSSSPDTRDICVTDDGPGIPAGLGDQIFEPFVRADEGGPIRGQGLGLAFCRLAVEAHGGTITVEPNVPQGTVFRIRLPRQPAPVASPLPFAGTGWTSSRLSRAELLAEQHREASPEVVPR